MLWKLLSEPSKVVVTEDKLVVAVFTIQTQVHETIVVKLIYVSVDFWTTGIDGNHNWNIILADFVLVKFVVI